MKRENNPRVQEIIKTLEEYEYLLNSLKTKTVNVEIQDRSCHEIHSTEINSTTEEGQIGKKYVEAIILYYETEINALIKELETL